MDDIVACTADTGHIEGIKRLADANRDVFSFITRAAFEAACREQALLVALVKGRVVVCALRGAQGGLVVVSSDDSYPVAPVVESLSAPTAGSPLGGITNYHSMVRQRITLEQWPISANEALVSAPTQERVRKPTSRVENNRGSA